MPRMEMDCREMMADRKEASYMVYGSALGRIKGVCLDHSR